MDRKGPTPVSVLPLSLALLLCLAPPAQAVDGVVLIDQNRALAGNVTPGDLPGFPVTISRPGSYRLSGNLDVADPDLSAIEVKADHVTLDLNGFTIQGPLDQCSFPLAPVWCSNELHGFGIDARVTNVINILHNNISILNGTIRAMGSHGVILGRRSRVERINVLDTRGIGIAVDTGSMVLHCIAAGNLVEEIEITAFGLFADNVCGVHAC